MLIPVPLVCSVVEKLFHDVYMSLDPCSRTWVAIGLGAFAFLLLTIITVCCCCGCCSCCRDPPSQDYEALSVHSPRDILMTSPISRGGKSQT
jgi:hypothetical protein